METNQTPVVTASDGSFVSVIDNTILELLPAAVYVCDRSGAIVRYNRKAVEFWGSAPQEGEALLGFYGDFHFFWPDGAPLEADDMPVMAALRDAKPTRNMEFRVERPDGTLLWALVNTEAILDGTGAVTGAVSCFQDITGRKLAEQQAQETQELLRSVVDTTPECVKIVDPDGSLLYMNDAGLRMVGAHHADAVVGSCVYDLIVPEHRDDWKEQHARVCGGERINWEFDIVGVDGRRRHMESHAVPLRMPDDRVTHLAVTRDVTARKEYETLLRDSERHLRSLLDAIPGAVYTTDTEGHITFFNQAAIALWGEEPPKTACWCGSYSLYTPKSAPLPHDQCPMAVAMKEGRPLRSQEAMLERRDGTRVPFLAYPTPLRDGDGRLIGGVNMLVDISERKQAEERQQLMINELNHRVKNTLATVQSIAFQTFGEEVSDSRKWFEGRLIALSEAHNILTRENWQGADLHDIVHQTTSGIQRQDGTPFVIQGPPLRLSPKMALSLALALHELGTNAAKHGALSNGSGRVAIDWTVTAAGLLRLHWQESGGPPVTPPAHRGFGSRFITRGLAHELRAEVQIDYAPAGLACAITVPLPRSTDKKAAERTFSI